MSFPSPKHSPELLLIIRYITLLANLPCHQHRQRLPPSPPAQYVCMCVCVGRAGWSAAGSGRVSRRTGVDGGNAPTCAGRRRAAPSPSAVTARQSAGGRGAAGPAVSSAAIPCLWLSCGNSEWDVFSQAAAQLQPPDDRHQGRSGGS